MKIAQRYQELVKIFTRMSKSEKVLLYAAIVIVLFSLLDRLIISPAFQKIRQLNKEIEEKELFIKRDARIVAEKEVILTEKNKFATFLSGAGSQEEQFTLILREIEELANKAQVYIIDMKPAGSKKVGSAEKYLVNLNCEANMQAAVNFMYEVENSARLLTVEKYQIAPKSGEASIISITMVISRLVVGKS